MALEPFGVFDEDVDGGGGLGVHGIVRAPSGRGGALGALEVRAGRALGDSGLELRGGLDIVFGAAGAFALQVGAAYALLPFDAPLYVGAEVDIGIFVALTGNSGASFLVRAGGIVGYRITERIFVEAALPELSILSANGGVVTLGASARAGLRF